MHPHGAFRGEQFTDLSEPIAHHRQPDRVLERVVVLEKALLRVEGRIEVGELDLAEVLRRELRQSGEAPQGVQGIAADEEVVPCPVLADVTDGRHVVKEPDFSHSVVGRRHPLVPAILMGKQPKVLVRPGQLQATLMRRQMVVPPELGHG